jgi:hypothetical protein
MSLPRPPRMVKLVMSFICSRERDFAFALSRADERYGPVDFVSEPLLFDLTDYYEPEMGRGLCEHAGSADPERPGRAKG